jgi:hypothetical protein
MALGRLTGEKFQLLKNIVTHSPVLQFFDPEKPTIEFLLMQVNVVIT